MDPAFEFMQNEVDRHRIINETLSRGDSCIQRFYSGAVVLVTGGSGFLGKQLIEKLFRSCDISKLYMLLRSNKKGKSMEQRFKEFLQHPLLEKLNEIKPGFASKIVPIDGDITCVGLGMSKADWTRITEEVTIIFHSAATVSFTEPLKRETLTNVRGTREMLSLGTACKNLKAFVHISTAYSHATAPRSRKTVLEKFYHSPISPKSLIELVEVSDEKTIDEMTPNLIMDWPNTYTFTKAVAEELVRTMGTNLPICIVRPSIVACPLREPAPGWTEPSCILGPPGFIMGAILGALHVMFVDTSVHLDYVPVDVVNNTVIAAAKETADRRQAGDAEIKIYCVNNSKSRMTIGELITYAKTEYDLPTDKAIWYNFAFSTSFKPVFLLFHWLLHLIPAYLADTVLQSLGKRPKAVKLCNILSKFVDIYEYFLSNDWIFGDENFNQLYWNLSSADRINFNCSMYGFECKHMTNLLAVGIRKYYLKDGLKNTLKAKKIQKLFCIANLIVLPAYFYLLWTLFYGFLTMIFRFIGLFY